MEREFVHQMEIEYDRRNLASDSLTTKTRDLMTVSAVMTAAITAFYGHMWSIADEKAFWLHLPIISVGIFVFTAVKCAQANSPEDQRTVFAGKKLMAGSEIKEDVVKSWTKAPKDSYYDSLIKEYVLCLRAAEDTAEKKAAKLKTYIRLFSGGCVLFPILVAVPLLLNP